MINKNEVKNCWEFWGCKTKEKCPAYITDSGAECWMVTNPRNNNSDCPRTSDKIEHCWECEWYKKFNPE